MCGFSRMVPIVSHSGSKLARVIESPGGSSVQKKRKALSKTKAKKKNRFNINKTKVNNSRNKKPLVVVSNTFKKANCAPSNNKKDYKIQHYRM